METRWEGWMQRYIFFQEGFVLYRILRIHSMSYVI